jgi:hypothetical protein
VDARPREMVRDADPTKLQLGLLEEKQTHSEYW